MVIETLCVHHVAASSTSDSHDTVFQIVVQFIAFLKTDILWNDVPKPLLCYSILHNHIDGTHSH